MRKTVAALALCGFAVVTAASPAAAQPLNDPIPNPIRDGGRAVRLEPVADGLTAPNWGVAAPGQPDRLFVVDQDGTAWALDLQSGARTVFLDVSDRLVPLGVGGPGTFDERGFLGLAFHPDYADNGLLYTYSSEPADAPADFSTMPPNTPPNHQSVVAAWTVANPSDAASVVDPSTR